MGWFQRLLKRDPDSQMERLLAQLLEKMAEKQKEDQDTRLVPLQVAGRIAGVSRRTLYAWMKAGKLPSTTTIGKGRRVRICDLFKVKEADESPKR